MSARNGLSRCSRSRLLSENESGVSGLGAIEEEGVRTAPSVLFLDDGGYIHLQLLLQFPVPVPHPSLEVLSLEPSRTNVRQLLKRLRLVLETLHRGLVDGLLEQLLPRCNVFWEHSSREGDLGEVLAQRGQIKRDLVLDLLDLSNVAIRVGFGSELSRGDLI